MRYLVNQTQMKLYDRNTIEYYGVPAVVLMERAALAVVSCIENDDIMTELSKRYMQPKMGIKRILVLCGNGNNGADGFAVARILYQKGYQVQILLTAKDRKRSELNALQLRICEKYGITMTDILTDDEYDMVVDALFGIGLNREVDEETSELMKRINQMDCPVMAIDIPSGLHTDSGQILGEAIHADVTVTCGFEKLGMYCYPGKALCGKIVCCPIGITQDSFLSESPEHILLEEDDIVTWLPVRPADGNKGTFGKVLLYAGQKNMAGAAILAARSCYRMGAGMVRILTCEDNRESLFQAVPEAILSVLEDSDTVKERKQKITDAVAWANVIAAGPGIGTDAKALEILTELLSEIAKKEESTCKVKPLILDADALNLLSTNKNLCQMVENRQMFTTVMTPHPMELARLAGMSIEKLKEEPAIAATEIVKRYGCILVAKDAVSTIYSPNRQIYMSASGNEGMATAGSGDVLTGMVAARCAFPKVSQTNNKVDAVMVKAVASAVYMHGMAGTISGGRMTNDCLMAGDLIEAIPQVIRQLRNV